jgi:hypothetical protein
MDCIDYKEAYFNFMKRPEKLVDGELGNKCFRIAKFGITWLELEREAKLAGAIGEPVVEEQHIMFFGNNLNICLIAIFA